MTTSEKKGLFRYENFLLIVLFIGFGMIFIDRFGFAMMFPMIAPELGLNATQLGMTMSALALAWGVSSYVFSSLSDFIGSKKKILAGAIFIFSLATLGTGLVQSFGVLLLLRAVMGLAEGPSVVLSNASMMLASSPKRIGVNIGFLQSSAALIGTAIGAVVVLGSAQAFGWRGALGILAIPGVIVSILLFIFMREPVVDPASKEKKYKPSKKDYIAIFKTRNIWVSIIMAFGMMTWWLTINSFFALYFTKVNNFTPSQVATFFTVFGTTSFVAAIFLPWLSDRIGRKPATIIGTFFSVISMILILTVHSFGTLTPIIAIVFLLGAGVGPLIVGIIPGESVPRALMATALGFVLMTGEVVAGTFSPILAGVLSDKYGLTMAMWVAFGGAMLQFLASFFLKETLPSKVTVNETLQSTNVV